LQRIIFNLFDRQWLIESLDLVYWNLLINSNIFGLDICFFGSSQFSVGQQPGRVIFPAMK
jgi:hypothetical protein